MSRFKRGKVYWAIWSCNGVRYQKSTGTGNPRLASIIERKLKDEQNARLHGLVGTQPDLDFTGLVADFVSGGGPKAHHKDRLKHLLPFFGKIPISQIGKSLVGKYRQYRYETDHDSAATV